MSFGALGSKAILALNLGARLGGFAHDTGEGGFSPYHRQHGGDIIWQIGSGYFGCRNPDGSFSPERFAEQAGELQVKMVEIKLSQGAKPGHGGVLPAAKVSPEIAGRARGANRPGLCFARPSFRIFDAAWTVGIYRALAPGSRLASRLGLSCVSANRVSFSVSARPCWRPASILTLSL
jgi:hypothetical protein